MTVSYCSALSPCLTTALQASQSLESDSFSLPAPELGNLQKVLDIMTTSPKHRVARALLENVCDIVQIIMMFTDDIDGDGNDNGDDIGGNDNGGNGNDDIGKNDNNDDTVTSVELRL